MTNDIERQLSVAEIEAQTPEGASELAAAEVMVRAATLLNHAFAQSGMTQKELAARLHVSEGRVSQIVNGDGNVRLATLARYLRATGYLTRIEADPACPGVKPLQRKRNRREPIPPHDLYLATVDHNGRVEVKLTALPAGVPISAPERSEAKRVGQTVTWIDVEQPSSSEIGA